MTEWKYENQNKTTSKIVKTRGLNARNMKKILSIVELFTNLTTACESYFMYINLIKTVFVDIVRMDMVRLCHAVYAYTPV